MKTKYKLFIVMGSVVFLASSCLKDLDLEPIDESLNTEEKVYSDPENYVHVLAKLYMGLALGGNDGGEGEGDIQGINSGFSQYNRGFWNLQELTTDEAHVAWTGDQTLQDLHRHTWSTSEAFMTAFYYRIGYQVAICNQFIKNSSTAKLSERGIPASYHADIALYRAEARFLRALSYWHGLDLYRNIPFTDENSPTGSLFFPEQAKPADLFAYIESELKALTDGEGDDDLADARTNEYARADKAAAQMVLAKLYLNAEVYIGESHYDECITEINKVIAAGYELEPVFQHLFLTDNHNSNEIIFPIAYDGLNTQTWGGTTLLVHAAIGGSMTALDYGVNSGWGGLRTTKELVAKFGDITTTQDSRAIFYTDGQTLEIFAESIFTNGYAVPKFRNVDQNGVIGQNLDHVDTDFPMFRLADAYLMYAEATLRGATNGNLTTALGYVNDLRFRAYGDNSGDLTSSELTLDFIIDERARELMWEAHRRTDLVRFGLFTGSSYIWEWKGFVKDGRATETHRDIFPIPSTEMNSNSKLKQNPNY